MLSVVVLTAAAATPMAPGTVVASSLDVAADANDVCCVLLDIGDVVSICPGEEDVLVFVCLSVEVISFVVCVLVIGFGDGLVPVSVVSVRGDRVSVLVPAISTPKP